MLPQDCVGLRVGVFARTGQSNESHHGVPVDHMPATPLAHLPKSQGGPKDSQVIDRRLELRLYASRRCEEGEQERCEVQSRAVHRAGQPAPGEFLEQGERQKSTGSEPGKLYSLQDAMYGASGFSETISQADREPSPADTQGRLRGASNTLITKDKGHVQDPVSGTPLRKCKA